jgi:uroporphyrinogen III methyltransferase/synthase
MSHTPKKNVGLVYLVGAGPGDPALMTLRGVECLRLADLVLYDYLVDPQVLEHAAAGAELVCLGRHGRDRIIPQSEINERLVREARAGKTIVRLKGGDPALFARTAEEAEVLVSAGIPFEIVPGITAALAASSYAGIPLTHRDLASAVALVAGQEKDDKRESALDYRALASFPGTLVFYMGVTTAPLWTKALIEGGKNADTPAAIIRHVSWPDQTIYHCTLGAVTETLAKHRIRPPALVIVGEVVKLEPRLSWFQSRPLFGVSVLVTRPQGQAHPLCNRLRELGAEVRMQPAIEIGPPDDWAPVDRALADWGRYDWLVFSSSNGVQCLLDRLLESGGDLRRLGSVKLAAIGPGTADELARYHLRTDLVPGLFQAEGLAAALGTNARGKRFLLVRASRGREVLAEELRAAGGHVEQIVVYSSRDVQQANPEIAAALSAGSIDWITVTSSAIARSLAALFGPNLRQAKLVSISPVTSATLRELGFEPTVEAKEATMNGVVDAIVGANECGR